MSIYSTIRLTKSEAIVLIAEHLCDDASNFQYLRDEIQRGDDNAILARILFHLTNGNKYSPYHDNNYEVVDNQGLSNLEQFKEEKYL